jgi:hypothetical protein
MIINNAVADSPAIKGTQIGYVFEGATIFPLGFAAGLTYPVSYVEVLTELSDIKFN